LALVLHALLFTAQAASVVLHDGSAPVQAPAQVLVATGLPASELRVVSLSELVEGQRPQMAGVGQVETCDGEPATWSEVEALLRRAEGRVNYMEYEALITGVEETLGRIGCLTETLHPEAGARLHMLRGVAHHALNDSATAWAEFRQAHIIAPQMVWPDEFVPEGKPLFDGTNSELASTPTMPCIIAPAGGAELWVDGRSVFAEQRPEILPGRHLIQRGTEQMTSLWVEWEMSDDAALVFPQAFEPEHVGWAAEPTRRDELGALLTALLDPEDTVFIPLDGTIWKFRVGDGRWSGILPDGTPVLEDVAPAENEVAASTRRPLLPTGLLAGGGAFAVGGAVLTAVGFGQAAQASAGADGAATRVDWNSAEADHLAATRRVQVGWALVGAGAVAGGVGFVLLTDGALRMAPWAAGQPGLSVQLLR